MEPLSIGSTFVVTPDHCSLKYLLDQSITTAEQQHLFMKLMSFYFTIVYKASTENKGADPLSTHPQYTNLLTLAMLVSWNFSTLMEALEDDTYTRQLLEQLSTDPFSHSHVPPSSSHLYRNSRF